MSAASKRPGALWATEPTDVHRHLPWHWAVGAALLSTLALGMLLSQIGMEQAEVPRQDITRMVRLEPPAPKPIVPAPSPKPKPLPPTEPVKAPAKATTVPSPVAPAPAIVAAAHPSPTAPALATAPATRELAPPTAPLVSAAPTVAPKAAAAADIGITCPTQVKPEMPRRALMDEISGTVRARALIENGVVKEVTILSGPKVFHANVRSAMLRYKCLSTHAGEVSAEQEFVFKVE